MAATRLNFKNNEIMSYSRFLLGQKVVCIDNSPKNGQKFPFSKDSINSISGFCDCGCGYLYINGSSESYPPERFIPLTYPSEQSKIIKEIAVIEERLDIKIKELEIAK